MFIRQFVRRNKDGSARVYLYLCRNYVSGGKERQELVAKLGRMDILQESGALDRLIASLARCSERCWVEVEGEGRLSQGQTYGAALVFRRLWERLEIGEVMGRLLVEHHYQSPVERALFALVANRALAPRSKLAVEEWVAEEVAMPGLAEAPVQQLYRAMDFLLEHREKVQWQVFTAVADLLKKGGGHPLLRHHLDLL